MISRKLHPRSNITKAALYSMIISLATSAVRTAVVHAETFEEIAKGGAGDVNSGGSSTDVAGILQKITSALLFLVGAVSVIVIIIAGLRFIFSNGDQQAVANARNTILYAVIGIIVAVTAYGLVNFVLTKIS